MNGWPSPAPPGDSTWDADWQAWFDRWIRLREPVLRRQVHKRLRANGAAYVSQEQLRAATRIVVARIGDRLRREGASWLHDSFAGELPFLGYAAVSIEREYVHLARKEQSYRSNVTPVSPLGGAEDAEKTAAQRALAALEDDGALQALERAEARLDYLARQAAPVRTALCGWWAGKAVEEIAAELGHGGERPAAYEVFVRILRCYRADTVEVVAAAVATADDPCDPCWDREAARAYIRRWILATERFCVTPGGRGYSAGELAELVASRAATPLGEDPEPFASIARRLGRGADAVERQYQRLCGDERHAWISHITLNRHPGNPADPRDERGRG